MTVDSDEVSQGLRIYARADSTPPMTKAERAKFPSLLFSLAFTSAPRIILRAESKAVSAFRFRMWECRPQSLCPLRDRSMSRS
jgi:hypothetical protein